MSRSDRQVCKDYRGFTLVELMIVMAVLVILILITYPAYTEQIRKARRAESQAMLLDAAQEMERYFTVNGTYVDAPDPADTDYYQIAITNATATAFTVQATPLANGGQSADRCGKLTYNSLGVKGIKDAATGITVNNCW